MIPGSYERDEPIIFTGFDNVYLKNVSIIGSIVNCIRKPFLYCFPLDKPPRRKISKQPGIKLFEKITKPVLSYLTLYFVEDYDHKPVEFIGETISPILSAN